MERPPPVASYRERIDPEEVDSAWRLLRSVTVRLDQIARQEGSPTPFGPARYLILVLLEGATAYGLSARRDAKRSAHFTGSRRPRTSRCRESPTDSEDESKDLASSLESVVLF